MLCASARSHSLSFTPSFAGSCPAHGMKQNECLVVSLSTTRSRNVAICLDGVCRMFSKLAGSTVGILDRQVYVLKT